MDEVDITTDRQEQEMLLARRQLATSVRRLKPVSKCYNCEEPVVENQLFCDVECTTDWEKRNGK